MKKIIEIDNSYYYLLFIPQNIIIITQFMLVFTLLCLCACVCIYVYLHLCVSQSPGKFEDKNKKSLTAIVKLSLLRRLIKTNSRPSLDDYSIIIL